LETVIVERKTKEAELNDAMNNYAKKGVYNGGKNKFGTYWVVLQPPFIIFLEGKPRMQNALGDLWIGRRMSYKLIVFFS
jgi:hypothetical protein